MKFIFESCTWNLKTGNEGNIMKKLIFLFIFAVILSFRLVAEKSELPEAIKGLPVLPNSIEYGDVIVNNFSMLTGLKFITFYPIISCDNKKPIVLAGKKQDEQIKEFMNTCNKDNDEYFSCNYMVRDNIFILYQATESEDTINAILDSKLELLKFGNDVLFPVFRKTDGELDNINRSAKAVIVDNFKMKGKTFLEVIEDYYKRHSKVQGISLGGNYFHVYNKPGLPKCRDMISKLSDPSRMKNCSKEEKDALLFSFCYYIDFEKDKLIKTLSGMDWMSTLTYRPSKVLNELRCLLFKRFSAVKKEQSVRDFLVDSFLGSKDLSFKYKILSEGLLPKENDSLYRKEEIKKNCQDSGNEKLISYFKVKPVSPRPPVIDKKGAAHIESHKFVQPETKKLFKRTEEFTYLEELPNDEFKEKSVKVEYECYKYKKPFLVYKLDANDINYTKSPEQADLSDFTENTLTYKSIQRTIADLKGTKYPLTAFEYRINFKCNGRPTVILFGYGYKKKNGAYIKSERYGWWQWNQRKWIPIEESDYSDKNILNLTLIDSSLMNKGYSFFDNPEK
jgi:hypothetical protein